ncbi:MULTISPECIES: hypothetical protein [Streptomyces]|uniref:Integral membrane protein n=1 Tax=Streptomyces albus (strain ATCC 21838 / DSM 41398 / FERM P-419 / JCM 4703 / NBRC 107858) TaxID=1081613 RepID=A0A0B5EUC1_STRA4|nr:hypothetical protein [Streptomyces sp. SCSIO ZS0520]AJE85314.1 hypothetical protein SLNWT_4938 [Streptomyces albus]AOU79621.1 hypothetical protein SLNHY_4930 [Streptomyces albus]AYN35344.1 hypothetical protein DUI70_4846 [Streptomyces albus]
MDTKNLFMTPTTAYLVRAEYALGLVVSVVLFFTHLGDINWWAAIGLFVYIDLIGYIPGAIAFQRAGHGDISKGYYLAYNIMHSLVTQGLVTLAWIWLWGPEWALLALPIHLFGDRSLFGNYLKPFGLRFEPETHEAFRRFQREYDSAAAAPAGSTDVLRTVS